MRFDSFRYLVKQGWRNMAANRLMTFASIGVLSACLIITGIASLLSLNINRIVDYLGAQNEIVVYILEGETAEESQQIVDKLGQDIKALPNISEVTFISKEAAFEEFSGMMESYSDLLKGRENVLPASYRVAVADLNLLSQTDAALRELPGVESVSAPKELAGVMITIKNGVSFGGWAMVILLGIVSIVIISNTIRLTVFARRREITIMKYVGATNAFIRLPFFVEGVTVGIISGLFSTGIVCAAYYFVLEYLKTGKQSLWMMGVMNSVMSLSSVWYLVLLGFVAFGVLVGGVGTAMSIRKHLKV